MALKFDIRGFKEIDAALNKRIEDLTKKVDAEMDKAVLEINAKQVSYTPVDTGLLRENNRFDISKPLNKSLYNKTDYAGYIEFGTGTYVFWGYPWADGEIENIAATWKGQGIKKINIYPRPFFFRAFFEEAPKMLARIKTVITE